MLYAILLFAFFIRYLPRIILPYAIADDGYNYFGESENIRKARPLFPEFLSKTVFKSRCGYSHYYPLLLSIFPKKYEILVESLLSPLFDTLLIFCSAKFFLLVFANSGIAQAEELVLYFTLLLSILPAFLRNDTGPRAYNGSARVMGQFIFLLIIFSYYHYLQTNSILFFVLGAALGSILFPLSAFASQAFVFTGLFIGIFSPMYFLVLLSSFVILYIFSFGKAIKMFAPRFTHYKWYFKFYQKVTLYKWSYLKNPFVDYFNQLKLWIKLFFTFKLRSVIIYVNLCYNPIHLLITSFFFYIAAFTVKPFSSPEYFLVAVSFACLIVFALTMMKRLLFLGESYRYLEFGIPPALIIFFLQFHQAEWFYYLIWTWIGVAAIRYIFFQVEFYNKYKGENTNYPVYKTFFAGINKIISDNVYASGHFRCKAAYFGDFNYLGNRGFINLEYLSVDDNYLAWGNYPYPSGDFESVIKRFDLRYWLTTSAELEAYLGYTKEFGDFKSILEPIASDEKIDTVLYRIKKKN